MGLKKLAGKVDEYKERLEAGKADKIEPVDVQKVLEKLRKKVVELERDIAGATGSEEIARLERKLEIARTHIARAEWLLEDIG
jgi:predicted  nucleic acid-binding Zn-ribbon protein